MDLNYKVNIRFSGNILIYFLSKSSWTNLGFRCLFVRGARRFGRRTPTGLKTGLVGLPRI